MEVRGGFVLLLPGRRSRSEPRAAPRSPLCRHRGFRRVSSCPCTSLAHARRGEGEYRPPWRAGGVEFGSHLAGNGAKLLEQAPRAAKEGDEGGILRRRADKGAAALRAPLARGLKASGPPPTQPHSTPPGTNIGLKNDTSRRGRSRRARVPAPISSALSPADRGPSFAFAVGFLARMQMKVPSFAALVCSPSFLPPAGIAAPQVLFHHPTRLSKPSPGPRGSGALPRAQKTPLGSEAKLQKGNEAFW